MQDKQPELANHLDAQNEQIAIVGVSLRLPGASTKAEFWNNLINKVSSIREIPADRWDWKQDFDPAPKKDEQKIISKWGGFINNIDEFDASFFAISPKEAESMDPQQRLSMELAWECFEDAGFSPDIFKNTKTGVYLGCSNTDYQEFSVGNIDPHFLTGMSTGVFANRISHYFNFQGPSETVDTACSSSLVAIHKAIKDFKAKEITAALVGGVNLLITKSRYVSFSKLGVLSPQGRCKTLDAEADGYVRGEGLGMLLLLPLQKALQEKAPIYGIIKGSSVGHSGKTNTLTSPNPFSQSRVIQEAHESAGIHSGQVSYVELHGTGTRLGDPIEIQGLKRAFRATKSGSAESDAACYLTTVKTNIGHLEPAAGISGAIKILLSFAHNQIPPLQNFEQLNPKISLKKTPFKLAVEPEDWPADEEKQRIAGISSFGFAGVNAHVLFEEPPRLVNNTQNTPSSRSEFAIILSAKNKQALQQRALQLLDLLQQKQLQETEIDNLAYTLQVGRQPMAHRFGCVVTCLAELVEQLQLFTQNEAGQWQQGKQSSQTDEKQAAVLTQEQAQNSAQNPAELLTAWINGEAVDWACLYDDNKPQRISLPTYPFIRKRFWISLAESTSAVSENQSLARQHLHPLLHETLPALEGLTFVSRFTGDEFFLRDHQVQQKAILPGVCTLEMVREAMALSHYVAEDQSIVISHTKWLRPLIVDGEQEIFLALSTKDATTTFELLSHSGDEQVIHAQGQVSLRQQARPVQELALTNNGEQETLNPAQIYALFSNAGLDYGPSFQGIQNIQRQGQSALAELNIEPDYCAGFGYSPALLDSALQSAVIFAKDSELALPFAAEQVEFFAAVPQQVWAKVTQIPNVVELYQKFDVDICDAQGKVCVRFKHFTTVAMSQGHGASTERQAKQPIKPENTNDAAEALFNLKPCWVSTTVPSQSEHALAKWVTDYKGPGALKPDLFTVQDEQNPTSEHLIWVAEGEYAEPLTLFQQIKSLLDAGYGAKSFAFTLVTLQTQRVHNEVISAQGAGLIGLMQSLAQEYPRWEVRIVDMQREQVIPWQTISALPSGFYAWRDDEWYRFEVASHQYQSVSEVVYRKDGVYLVLGGAGGLGQVWSEWMIRNYDAQLIWIGRREQNAEIQHALANLGKIGKTPLYFSVDAADEAAMQKTLKCIKERLPEIHGVVHSILHLEDQSLANMTSEQFLRSYTAKQQTGDVLLKLFKGESLDFCLFFSSLQSFSPAPGQSNYAAGCHYLDSLALTHQDQLPIKVVNWGYWGSVGVVQDAFYQKKMQQAGIGSIDAAEGMQALAQLLASSMPQIGVVKMRQMQLEQSIKQQSFSSETTITSCSETTSSIRYIQPEELPTQAILQRLCRALHRAAWHTTEQRQQALSKLPEYFHAWWQETANYLQAAGLLKEGALSELPEDAEQTDNETNLLDICLAQLPLILSGEKISTDVVFPNGSLHLVEAVYQKNAVADYANQVLVEQLQQYLAEINPSSVKLLEIGAGTGGTTAAVLPALSAWNVEEYAYTDLSKAFFEHAKANFQPDYPFIQTKYFDVSKPLVTQNIQLASYDVVIATNVLHATPKIRETLQNAKACLKPGGILLINEVMHKSLFTQLTFGLLEGWWLSQDKALRIAGSPMLSLDNWTRILGDAGFINTYAATHSASPQHILLAQSDGQIQQAVNRKKAAVATAHTRHQSTQDKPTTTANHNNVLTFVQQTLFEVISDVLNIPEDELDAEDSYADYGVDSILGLQLLEGLIEKFELSLPATLLFDYPSIASLSEYIATEHQQHLEQFVPRVDPVPGDVDVLPLVQQTLFDVVSEVLSIPENELDAEDSYADYGVDSILGLQLLEGINEKLDLSLPATMLFDYPSIATLSEYIATEHQAHLQQSLLNVPVQTPPVKVPNPKAVKLDLDQAHYQPKHIRSKQPGEGALAAVATDDKIAIVGMSGQFGTAADLEAFWSMIKNKETSVVEQQRWELSSASTQEQAWCRYASLLKDIAGFDADFFSIMPQEAMYMDPQQRLVLQECWKALEDANMTTQVSGQNVGVYLGCAAGDYASLADDDAPAQLFWGNASSVIPARISYFLDLKGPAIAIDTACSSSLVAIHMASQALLKQEISSALVGGVATLSTAQFSKHAGKAGMLSPDGTCYTFDDRANGFVPGEGVGVLVLKRLADAQRDQDHIYGVILGSGTNQDGTTSGITAPSSLSQEQLERAVYERFNISAESIQMVEAHGTGTKLGDPIEFHALTQAFRKDTEHRAYCALGSVKTNIGHCLTAAGVAGVIKVLLAMQHQSIPASLHFAKGNSHIHWDDSPFVVHQEAKAWDVIDGQPRRAAVSSFGFSGTNAHLVLEEYPAPASATNAYFEQPPIIVLSAKTPEALIEQARQLHRWLQVHQPAETDCVPIAYTLQTCRQEMDYRMGFIASSVQDMQTQLERFTQHKRGNWQQGEAKLGKDILASLDEHDFIRWLDQQAFHKLLALWVVGASIDWHLLYHSNTPRKLRLPTYPFTQQHYWIPTPKPANDNPSQASTEVMPGEQSTGVNTQQLIFNAEYAEPADAAQMLHYTASWQPSNGQQITHQKQRMVLSIGDLGLTEVTVLQSSANTLADQLEDYANQLLQQLQTVTGTKNPVLLQLVVPDTLLLLAALSGLLKTAALEFSYLTTQLILVEQQTDINAIVEKDAACLQDQMIRYQDGRREVLSFVEQALESTAALPWKENGVYVITGGLGQLGQFFAQEILRKTRLSTVVLVGRKPDSEAIRQKLAALSSEATRLHYVVADIASQSSVQALMQKIIAEHGTLSGIMHSAGVIQDQLISNKTVAQVHQVFAPKVAGVVALDEASQAMDLDFFVCFSSIAAVFGNIGQADYAAANAFLDQFMQHRQGLVERGERQGMSLSINWPFWDQGGMQLDEISRSMLQSQGITPLPNEQALQAFYQTFAQASTHPQNCFLYGDARKLSGLWTQHIQQATANTAQHSAGASSADIMDYLKEVVSSITLKSPTALDEDIAFRDMGLDSIMSMSIAQRLEEKFGNLPPALLFEVNTLRELHDYLLEQHGASFNSDTAAVERVSTGLTTVQPAPADAQNNQALPQAPLTLSKAQQGLWLLHKQYPQMSAYNVPWVLEIHDYNHRHMQEAVDWLGQKYPILRVTMREDEGLPRQQLQDHTPVVAETTLSVASTTELVAKIRQDIQQPFAMNGQLLWRAQCWHITQGMQSLNLVVIVFHHIIIDGVSSSFLLEQLWAAYKKRQHNQALVPATPDVGFFAYLEWEKALLSKPNALSQKLRDYWINELRGELPVIQLLNRKANQQGVGEQVVVAIENTRYQRVKQYLENGKVNAPVFFLTALQLLLSRYTGQQDMILGVPVLHRPQKAMAQSVGLFVNQLPLRNTIDPNQDFLTLAKSNQTKLLNLINHSGYPFPEIVKASNAPRSPAFHPIFQMGYIYQNFLQEDWFNANQDLVDAIWEQFQGGAELEFGLEVTPMLNQYRLAFKYDVAVYSKATLEELAQAYLALLEEVLFSDNTPIANYRLFADARSSQTSPGAETVVPISHHNNDAVKPVAETTVVHMFEAQARKNPNHIALTFGAQSITYAALNQKANALANYLMQQGAQHETLIGICIQPSLALVIGILGILKSGAAYVPIDANSPEKRMRFILEDAQPSLLLLQSGASFAQAAQAACTAQVVYLDAWLADFGNQPDSLAVSNPDQAHPKSLAYIIYTSGSTGRPKGVLVEHRNVAQLMQNTQALFNFSAHDTWCLFHSYAFDFSVWEIWGALVHGGKLAIPDDLTRKDSVAFYQFVVDQQVSVLNQTPSAFFSLMDIILNDVAARHKLRIIIFGGEALELIRLKPWFKADSHLPQLVNMYGITETTVHVTEITVTSALVQQHTDKSIIGKPLPGYCIYLLDEQQRQVEPGQVGEIHVGGLGVSRGYYQRLELTAERFIRDPFSADPNARLYRSGDLARMNAQGQIEYIGRADDQVQIRGHRIELGEVQQALLALDAVTNACVIPVDKQRGKVLAAYLIASKSIPVATLRVDLKSHIPEYMIPALFVFVDAFPLTANGKIDKAALARLPSSTHVSNDSVVAANNTPSSMSTAELQTSVAEIWQTVLEIDYLNLDEPFFEAGGDSLLANVLSAKIEAQLGLAFPMTMLFQYSSIRAITQYLAEQNSAPVHAQATTTATMQIDSQAKPTGHNNHPDYYASSLAVIGMSCHYPDAGDHQAFWQQLLEGKDFIKRLNLADDAQPIMWLDSWVEGQELFDPDFFKISEKNAKTLSFSLRQLLMHAWKAVEDAGYRCDEIPKTGVYISSSGMDTPDFNLQEKLQDGQFILNAEDYVASTLNQPGTLPTMISYHLGFSGPSLFVHSNCSSSLSALALASQALQAKEIDYAIVGAACLYPQRYTGYAYEKGLNFASDARCKVFDAKADGMVGGNGVAVIVLKRADNAVADRDHIYSLVRGININNDGKDKAGFFAPGTKGQMQVIQQALQDAEVNPASISYVEAHGTGTSLGDPIEFTSLQQVYQQYSDSKQFCGLGAVKSNLGHTDTLAGLSGLLKTSLALKHKKIPASLHYAEPNPQINLQNSPFYIVDRTQDWDTALLPRRAAVSSFGIGGTNAHLVLEEYTPESNHTGLQQQPSIIVLSAAKKQVLAQQVQVLLAYLQKTPLEEQQLANLAYTLQTGRKVMQYRTGFVVTSFAELQQKLQAYTLKPDVQSSEQSSSAANTDTQQVDQAYLAACLAQQQYADILRHWIDVGFTDWGFCYQGEKLAKLSLPTYPFALKPYALAHVADTSSVNPSPTSTKQPGNLQLLRPEWAVKASAQATQTQAQRVVVFCDIPSVNIPDATTVALFSGGFSLEQKIEDYGYQLVEIAKDMAKSKQPTTLQLVLRASELPNLYVCFHSLLKTASLECSALNTQVILLDSLNDIDLRLSENLASSQDSVIRYRAGIREVLEYQAIRQPKSEKLWKAGGVYLISGGLGGIGAHLIAEINRQSQHTTVIATGRKPVDDPQVQQQLAALRSDNTTLKYYQLDVAQKPQVIRCIRDILSEFQTLSGVIHAAGVVQDTLLVNKQQDVFKHVLAPKVRGVLALDEATQDLPLDFFICFAGLSGVHGAVSQIDYATANAFLDSYMQHRAALVLNGERSGKSCSIDWPYWQDGGMRINSELASAMGQNAMPTDRGISAFYQSLQYAQTLVVYTQQASAKTTTNSTASNTSALPVFTSHAALQVQLADHLLQITAALLGVSTSDIDPDADLGDFGADSIVFISFINQINQHYQLDLTPTVLFKHSSLNSLVEYLLDEHIDELATIPTAEEKGRPGQATQVDQAPAEECIAIIGMSGEFPEAKDLDAFWQNLAEGKDCITQRDWSDAELPAEIQWLGSVAREDDFDPLFFNIPPSESVRIQRQESLLMMHVWKCIEDAGYDPLSLAGSNTGLFIGCQANYHDGMLTSHAFAPNRMSYFLDLHGPSEGIDTTCSSSLVAVHKAIQAIQQGDCDQAIVGGVNMIESPQASLALHDIGALSPEGRCKTFAADADGFVRGEGVGMIFIKKLSACQRDKDAVYATILGSALNHGGKSQGFTVPNAKAQSMLLTKAWQSAGIDPATLSYIECHGTGTSLGDPVEVDALKDAFKQTAKSFTESPVEQTSCALGSVKSNIGHLEIAAGIAGVIKVLLQLKHKTLVPSLHVKDLNPYLALEDTPFKVQTENAVWNAVGKRRAAVSSFGISGVNAHLVLEEFVDAGWPAQANNADRAKPAIIVLSASSKASLLGRIHDLHACLATGEYQESDRDRLAYTLQIGRPDLKYRMAWQVASLAELADQLAASMAQGSNLSGLSEVASKPTDSIQDQDLIKLRDTDNHAAIMRFWLAGKKINWLVLYPEKPYRLNLPSYPFTAKESANKQVDATQAALQQDQWLLLNNHWQNQPLACPADWQSHIGAALQGQQILLLSETATQQARLLALLQETQSEGFEFSIASMLFKQIRATSSDAVPDIVIYIGNTDNPSEATNVNAALKHLFEYLQSIEQQDNTPIQLFYVSFIDDAAFAREDVMALLRSYSLRNPKHAWSMVEFVQPLKQADWSENLLQELVCPSLATSPLAQPNQVQYRQQERFGIQVQKQNLEKTALSHFKQNGVYLIAGALGELGIKLSQCLLQQYSATLILLGRRSSDASKATLDKLSKLPGAVHYVACDISDESDLQRVVQFIDAKGLSLNGIFHLGAGSAKEESCWDDFARSMQVKVQGSMMLDRVFSAAELDFYMLFSSMAVFGSLNHLSYSYGNGFQNYFSAYRNALVKQEQRHGKTLALNWGYWHSDDPVKNIENSFAQKKGYALIQMDEAFHLMDTLLAAEQNTLGAVFAHDADKIYQNTSNLLLRKSLTNNTRAKPANLAGLGDSASVADTVINIISDVIDIAPEELDLERDLYEYGFDSIYLLKTFQQLQQQLTIDIQADAFKNMNTIQSLIDDIEMLYQQESQESTSNGIQAAETPDFILDAGLAIPDDIDTLEKAYRGDIKAVLLTGATGFLGGHILHELLSKTDATIYCLTRANTLKKAQERILQNALTYKLDIDMERVVPILGDVEKPRLGMSKVNWRLLAKEVQHIVHTASYVNHIQPYFAFKKSVNGTSELLSLAYTNTLKMLHFVSSTTVSTQVNNSHFSVNPAEDFIDVEKAELILSGYGQSKWVQEENIRLAALSGVPYTIYRFSEISGSSQTGIGNTNDVFHRILRMMLSIGVQPKDANYLLDVIPVDMAASAIVSGMDDPKKRNVVYNVANSNPLAIADLYRYATEHDLSFNTTSKATFIDACKHYVGRIEDASDQVIMQGLLTQRPGYDEFLFETYLMPLEPYDKDNFLHLMSTYAIDFVAWETLFDVYFRRWKEDNYYQVLWE